MVTALFDALTSGGNGFIGFIKNLLTAIVEVFYDKTNAVMTDFGQVFLIAVAASLTFWGLGFISKLFKLKN